MAAAAAIVAERIEAGEPPPNANGCAMAVGFKSARSGGAGHEVIAGHGLPRRGRPNVLDWPMPPDDDGEQSWLNVGGNAIGNCYMIYIYARDKPGTNWRTIAHCPVANGRTDAKSIGRRCGGFPGLVISATTE